MGLFDALRTRRADEASTSSSADPLGGGSEELAAAAAAATASADAAATLGALEAEGGAGGRLYNPYEGLATAIDGRGLRGTYRLPTQVRGRGGEGEWWWADDGSALSGRPSILCLRRAHGRARLSPGRGPHSACMQAESCPRQE